MLLVLVALGAAQQLRRVMGQVHRISAVDGDGAAGDLPHVVVEDLRMLLFLPGGEEEYRLQHLELLLTAHFSGKGVAVSSLALPGKGPHQILQRLTVFQLHRYPPA